jgi:hypothetical protein
LKQSLQFSDETTLIVVIDSCPYLKRRRKGFTRKSLEYGYQRKNRGRYEKENIFRFSGVRSRAGLLAEGDVKPKRGILVSPDLRADREKQS